LELRTNITAELDTLALKVGSPEATTGELHEYDSRVSDARGHDVEYSSSNGYFHSRCFNARARMVCGSGSASLSTAVAVWLDAA
jgi:hypothetical protein